MIKRGELDYIIIPILGSVQCLRENVDVSRIVSEDPTKI
jgi:hypothetical protein